MNENRAPFCKAPCVHDESLFFNSNKILAVRRPPPFDDENVELDTVLTGELDPAK